MGKIVGWDTMILGMEFPLVGILLQPAFWIVILLIVLIVLFVTKKSK